MTKEIRLEDGTILELQGDTKTKVKFGGCLLGDGGQGIVYRVRNKKDGKYYALKMYKKPMSKAFLDNLRNNIVKGAPDDSFIWPLGLTEPQGKDKDRHGYLMELYGKGYVTIAALLKGRANFASKEVQIAALIELVDAFEKLHAKGYSYQDLNDGGIQFDVTNGKALICDNDNVAPYGENLGVLGKFKYMAPEVAIKMFRPDKYSDRFSLAVLMFMILTHAHPFDGIKRLSGQMTKQLEELVYGKEPVFIFHPTNTSNRPDPQIDANANKAWPMLPSFIQDLFIKTFTSGMPAIGRKKEDIDPERQNRTTEKEWKDALYRWLDTAVTCPVCGKSICVDVVGNKIAERICPHCKKRVRPDRPIIVVKKNGKVVRTIALEDGKSIAKSCVTSEKSNEPAFIVKRSPKRADAYGIENLLPYQWKCTQAGANDRLVKTNQMVAAFNGVNIEFDYTYSGEIFYKF